ncbi:undecaprenyl-diphosphate phosphatase [Rhabdochlamydiaceae symbiont of Dictyostelium giganteum]|uniref:undecaprenyl-diphosphate phosphatase n=1 Tax=Rhabdochlamydiaceae symbiont of Dictyostelium giganteum TaxID=3342349 RepID=UPI00384CC63F
MNILSSIILGLIQGFTEFLPISSSAHLALARRLLSLSSDENTLFFDLTCHIGTLIVLIWYFRKTLYALIFNYPFQLLFYLVALLPLVPAYLLVKPYVSVLTQPYLLGPGLLITACILFLAAKKREKNPSPLSFLKAFGIGLSQVIALIPGISRSASTITAGLYLDISIKEAVAFSFLLSIPSVMGGIILESFHLIHKTPHLTSLSNSLIPCMMGLLASIASGFISINMMIPLLEKKQFLPFARYCLMLSIFLMIHSIL